MSVLPTFSHVLFRDDIAGVRADGDHMQEIGRIFLDPQGIHEVEHVLSKSMLFRLYRGKRRTKSSQEK